MKDQIYGVIGSFTVKRSRGKGGGRIRRIHEFAGMFELEIKSKAGIQYKSIKVRLGDAFGYSHGHGKMYGETITFKKEYNDRNKGDEQYQYELTKIGDKT